MGRKKGNALPFDKAGGVIAISARMLRSDAYLALRAQSKTLMILMQLHWQNEKAVDYGVREAAKKIPCSEKTAGKAFNELEMKGFISLVDESLFSSRVQSRSRSWRLNWLPFKGQKPTNKWEKLPVE